MRRFSSFIVVAVVAVVAVLVVLAAPAAAAPSEVFQKSGITDWTKSPPPTKEPTFKPPTAKRMKLKNGAALLVVENHGLPIVSIAMVVPGAGAAADPSGKGGLASFTADLLDEGIAGMTAIGIAEEQDRLGASIGVHTDVDAAYVSVSTLTKTLDQTIDLATKIITAPAFDDKDVERVKGDRMISLEQRRDRPREVAALMLTGALFGPSTAYGHPGSGTRDELETIEAADVRTFYKEHWNPAVMTIVVVGDVDPAKLKTKLDATFGAWKPTGVKKPARPVAKPAAIANRLLLVDRPAAAQSDVRIGIVGPDRKDPRFFQFEVFRTTLGDGFTSRLVQRLREQLGITYGANASMDWRLVPGPFTISTAIVTPETAHGLTETLKIVDDFATTDVPAEELEKSKQNLIRALPAHFGTNAATAGAFAELALHGLPDDWFQRYAAGIRKVTAKNVRAVAKSVAPSNKLVISIVGDMSKVRPEIDKLGLGEPAMHDPYGVPLLKAK
jgi:zinc protease